VACADEGCDTVPALRDALEQAGPVACQTSDAEAWWPDSRDAHGPSARMALDACRRCEAAGPCLAYALAADHRYGVWARRCPRSGESGVGPRVNDARKDRPTFGAGLLRPEST
jgi:hypothetical protein